MTFLKSKVGKKIFHSNKKKNGEKYVAIYFAMYVLE